MQSKVDIKIPNNNLEERRYVIDVILQVYLGIPYELTISDSLNTVISFNGKELIVRDAFWNNYPIPLSYLFLEYLPRVFFSTNSFLIERDLPVLYGTDEISVMDSQIICGIDLWASVFFMLTRWEEYVSFVRDQHGRFFGVDSIAYKNHFLHRPIVNEYVEMLWNMLVYLGYKGQRKVRAFEFVLTHDVDVIQSPNPLRTIVGDLVKRRNISLALSRIPTFFVDPVNTFSFLMDVSESIGVKSHFYFMAIRHENNKYDGSGYIATRRFISSLKEIKRRGHIVGFHPGYKTYLEEQEWYKQKERLEHAVGGRVEEGRQHYLRIEVPYTLSIWDKMGMKMDSTLGYADREGFRCGTGDRFPVFDFLRRTVLDLCESPLIVMDGSLRVYQNMEIGQAKKCIQSYIECGKRYKMPVTFLFHNSSFDDRQWKGWKDLYKEIIQSCG